MQNETGIQSEPACCFRIRNKQVQISYRGREFRVYNSVGMAYLVELLTHPGVPVRYAQLDMVRDTPQACYRQFGQPEALLESGLHVQDAGLPYAMADRQTLGSIKARLNAIIAELAVLEEYNDYAAADALREEQETLVSYLREVYRPGDKLRSFSDAGSRHKRSILKALRRALADIAEQDNELAAELNAALELNEYLVFRPAGLEIDIKTL